MRETGLLARMRTRFRNPFRTMYGSGHTAKVNPSMAAAAQQAPEAIPHQSLGPDVPDRPYGGAGIVGEKKPEEERSNGT